MNPPFSKGTADRTFLEVISSNLWGFPQKACFIMRRTTLSRGLQASLVLLCVCLKGGGIERLAEAGFMWAKTDLKN